MYCIYYSGVFCHSWVFTACCYCDSTSQNLYWQAFHELENWHILAFNMSPHQRLYGFWHAERINIAVCICVWVCACVAFACVYCVYLHTYLLCVCICEVVHTLNRCCLATVVEISITRQNSWCTQGLTAKCVQEKMCCSVTRDTSEASSSLSGSIVPLLD